MPARAEDPMFDVRSLLDQLLRGDPRSQDRPPASGAEDPGGSLAQLAAGEPGGAPAAADARPPAAEFRGGDALAGPSRGDDLEAILRHLSASASPHAGGATNKAGEGGLGDLLAALQGQAAQGRGGLLDALGELLGQAAAGVREGSGHLDAATGASTYAREAIEKITGKSHAELVVELKALAADNRLGAGVALGGLGALVLGTQAGRALAATAAKLGGLALIGGLGYKAYQNYHAGRPVLAGAQPAAPHHLTAAPEGSGFEAGALSHDGASLLIRTMIAAAAADGRIDAGERQKILGSLRQAGSSAEAQRFLMQEVQRPASPAELAREVSSPEQAVQVYTAARIAVDLDDEEEHAFLRALAAQLGIDGHLAAHIDAAARGG
jgi:uncharacterized membrane protein YebE (DUF533 family)